MFPPDRMITQRRREEEVRGALTQKVEAELNDKKFAEWVNNTHDKILHRRKLEVVDEFTQAHQRTVEERRERLQALLVAEQEEYFKALDNMVETQDQRKQRLATHALELKQHRESKRQEIAKSKMDQAFRENCDVLRGAITRQNTLQVAIPGRRVPASSREDARAVQGGDCNTTGPLPDPTCARDASQAEER